MKPVAAVVTALSLLAAPASAGSALGLSEPVAGQRAAAPVHFLGLAKIATQAGDCKGNKLAGVSAFARFMPGGFPDKLPGALTLFFLGETHAFVLAKGKFTKTMKPAKSLYVALGWASYPKAPSIAVTSTDPSTIKATTKKLKASIKLKGLAGLTGCTITLDFSGDKAS